MNSSDIAKVIEHDNNMTRPPIRISYLAPDLAPYPTLEHAITSQRRIAQGTSDASVLVNTGWDKYQSENLTTIKTLSTHYADLRPIHV